MKTLNKDLAAIQLNQVIEQLKEMSDSSLQVCHNNYCIELGYEDEVFDNDEYNINEHFNTPFDALLALEHYNLSDDYFYFHNGNLISFNYLTGEDSPITFSELAQWLINEDKLSEYDITVITLDDMLASIEDNISDNKYLLSKLADYLGQSLNTEQVEQLKTDDDYYEYLVSHFMNELDDYIYSDLYYLINTVGINYSVN